MSPQRLAPCGTASAYSRHYSQGEKPCDKCREEHRRRQKRFNQQRSLTEEQLRKKHERERLYRERIELGLEIANERHAARTLPTLAEDLPDWSQAACIGIPTDMFYPEHEGNDDATAAAEICRGCPIRGKCLDWALKHETPNKGPGGIWGGMNAEQRRRELRRSRNAA